MKKITFLLIIALICVSAVFGYDAFTYTFIIDSSASVSENDFNEANENIAMAIEYLYNQALRNPGARANQISVAWFGGQDDYVWLSFCNGSDYAAMSYAFEETYYKSHPEYGATAIYSAIAYSAIVASDFENTFGVDYLNVFFVITDGEDGDSPADHKDWVRSVFPSNDAYLSVIGVGGGANVSEFYSIANEVVTLDDFGDLFETIAVIQEYF